MFDETAPAKSAPAKNHVHQAIAQAVRDHGIDTMFGLMGDANLFIADHFARTCGGRFVPGIWRKHNFVPILDP